MSSLIKLEWQLSFKTSDKYVKILMIIYVKKQNYNEIISCQRLFVLN